MVLFEADGLVAGFGLVISAEFTRPLQGCNRRSAVASNTINTMSFIAKQPVVTVSAACALVGLLGVAPPSATSPRNNPRELGLVHWGRNLDAAIERSKQTSQPVLLLFQEIPGCESCVNFGETPLSHPLLVEAIEDLFIPVAIANNHDGYDAEILKRFDEPPANFPVMRFLNAQGRDVIERQDSMFSVYDVSKRMVEALAAAERDVPEYLQLAMLEGDQRREHRERLTFAMPCFWEGEGHLGAIDGVVATRAAFYQKQEVVDVIFDPTIVSIDKLVAAADKTGCASTVYAHGDSQLVRARTVLNERAKPSKGRVTAAPDDDQKHALKQSPMRFLPLTPMQATKVNAALAAGEDARRFLSPRQIALLQQIESALKANLKSLNGLTPPDSIAKLPAYSEQLAKRLR